MGLPGVNDRLAGMCAVLTMIDWWFNEDVGMKVHENQVFITNSSTIKRWLVGESRILSIKRRNQSLLPE